MTSKSETTRAVVKGFMNCLLRYPQDKIYADADLNDFFTDDIELVLPGTRPATPWAGVWRGKDELLEFWAVCAEHLDIISHDIKHIIVEDDKAVVIAHEKAASHVTGRKMEQNYAWLFIVRDGKICYWRLFEETEAIARCFAA